MNCFNAAFIKITGIVLLSVILGACGGGDSDLLSPGTSVPLPTGTGTDPDPDSGTGVASINWTPPTENTDDTVLTDLAGYKIYYGTSPDSLTNVITINNVGLTSYVVDILPTNTTCYFSVTAFNSNGIESGFSNIVSKQSSG